MCFTTSVPQNEDTVNPNDSTWSPIPQAYWWRQMLPSDAFDWQEVTPASTEVVGKGYPYIIPLAPLCSILPDGL